MSRRLLPLLTVLALVPACQRTSDRHAAVDQPQAAAIPSAQGLDDPRRERGGMSEAVAARCGRGTGRNSEGDCVPLHTRDVGYVQRVKLPAGKFVMGGSLLDYDATHSQEANVPVWPGQPPHIETIGSFWIDLHEVTRESYEKCVEAGKCTAARCPDGRDLASEFSDDLEPYLPQTCVTHEQATTYCTYVEGRLPTEAEWEYAARGPDARVYPWGNELDDGLVPGMTPVGRQRVDTSYHGILGLGTNAVEWVADAYDPDRNLRPFLEGEFRDPKGPTARARDAFERKLACGDDGGCRVTDALRARRVVKMTKSSERFAAREQMPAHPTGEELEGWPNHAHHPKLGFRCAADLGPGEEPLEGPEDPPALPLIRLAGTVELFGGAVSGVTKQEAERFCEVLAVDEASTGNTLTDWRLPSRHEIRSISDNFRGPGPFWARDGATAQRGEGPRPMPTDPWVDLELGDDQTLGARCVRDAS